MDNQEQRKNLKEAAKVALNYRKEDDIKNNHKNNNVIIKILLLLLFVGVLVVICFIYINNKNVKSGNHKPVPLEKPNKRLKENEEIKLIENFYNQLNSKNIGNLRYILSDTVLKYDFWKNKKREELISLIESHYYKISFEKDSIYKNTIDITKNNLIKTIKYKSTYKYQLKTGASGINERDNILKLDKNNKIFYYESLNANVE